MVAKTGGYFPPPFQGYCGLTQVDPVSPTVFNVVVDAVIRNWITVVVLTEETIQELAALFYADCGLVESPRPEKL